MFCFIASCYSGNWLYKDWQASQPRDVLVCPYKYINLNMSTFMSNIWCLKQVYFSRYMPISSTVATCVRYTVFKDWWYINRAVTAGNKSISSLLMCYDAKECHAKSNKSFTFLLRIQTGNWQSFLQASVDHHGYSMNSGHYTASINCCAKTYHCNDNKITECNITDTYNSSTAYIRLYRLMEC